MKKSPPNVGVPKGVGTMTSGLADTPYNLILSTINIFEALNFVDITFTRGFLKFQ